MQKFKFAFVLMIVALCCFVFAGTALAVESDLVVKADGETFAYTGCENSYTFELTNIIGLDADCLADNGATITISFKNNDGTIHTAPGFGILDDVSLPVKIYVEDAAGEGEWYFTQPTVDVFFGYCVLHVEPMDLTGKITKVFIGDEEQDLWVRNTCKADKYCIEVAWNSDCGDMVRTKNFEIKSAPYGITADVSANKQTNLPCNEAISVVGKVYDCFTCDGSIGNGVPNWPLTVTVLQDGDVVATAPGSTDGIGEYDIDFVAEGIGPGWYDVEVTADDAPCYDPVGRDSFFVEKNLATNIEIEVTDWDGVDDQLRYNKCNLVTVKLFDDCGYPAVFKEDPKIYLTATTPGDPPIVAGHFYKDCPEGLTGRDENQINYICFRDNDLAQSEKSIYVIPLVTGDITLTAAGMAGANELYASVVVPSIAPTAVDLEIVPLVTDDAEQPRAGWPLAACVRLDYTASDNYDVTFSANGEPIDFDAVLVAAFDYEDADNDAIYPYCTKKQYYYLYPSPAVRGDLAITVNVEDVGSDTEIVGSFVSPVELERTLQPDAWQTFSTPKLLADPGEETPEYGTFRTLLDPIYDEMNDDEIFVLKFRNGEWRLVSCGDEVEPLEGYFVRTPQRDVAGRDPFVLKYVFARATDPAFSMPYWYDFEWGQDVELAPEQWNSVGVGVSPTLENTLTRQSDTAAHAFASLLKDEESFLLWNPGDKLANVNDKFVTNALGGSVFPNTTYDAFTPMFNGDVYWLYGSCWDQDFSTNVGLDLIEWIGSDYEPDFGDDLEPQPAVN